MRERNFAQKAIKKRITEKKSFENDFQDHSEHTDHDQYADYDVYNDLGF